MARRVVFSPEAEENLVDLYQYIASTGSPERAAGYVEAIVGHCEKLAEFPMVGVQRADIRSGLRVTHYGGSAIIAFVVQPEEIAIIGVFYGGRNYEAILKPPDN